MSKTAKPKPIRALLGFRTASDADILSRAKAVLAGMTGNTKFATPPVAMDTLKTAIDVFAASVADALDGSKKAITTKHKDREALIKLLRQLATYVEAASDEDMAIFTSSGFTALSTKRNPPQELAQ